MKTIIFDFDGTLADSFSLLVETFSSVAKRAKPLEVDEIAQLREMKVPEVLKYLGIKRWQIPRLLIKGRTAMNASIDKVEPIAGIADALRELDQAGYQMCILSTNSSVNISYFLHKYDLAQYFGSVHGNVGIFNKAAALKKLIRKKKLNFEECIYVGDEVRDIEAARKINLKLISVGWGFSTLPSLEKQDPKVLIRHPSELKAAVDAY